MSTANAIRIKRRKYNSGNGGGAPGSLQWGELAYNEVDNILYYGYGSGTNGEDGIVNSENIYSIAGSGKYVDRSSDQTISGDKTFLNNVNITGNLNVAGNSISFDQATVVVTTLNAFSGVFDKLVGSGLDIIAPNTDNESVGYFAVFDTNPNTTLTRLKSVSKNEILDDIGAATSGLTITAGSGLQGGGTLSEDRTFDIITGYGIDIANDSVVVDTNEVVVTTGVQTVSGVKTFSNRIVFQSGLIGSGVSSLQAAASANSGTYFPVFTGSPVSESQNVVSRTAVEVKGDIGLSNVTNHAQIKKIDTTIVGNVPTWSVTTGDELGTGYAVETSTLTGDSSSLARADVIKNYVDAAIIAGFETNDAMMFKGALDCSANPLYPSGDAGHTYKISVSGKIGGAAGPVVEVNDTLICSLDDSPEGNHATVGVNWVILQSNIVDKDILVTGPVSAVSGNLAIFDGTTGKIIKDSSLSSNNIVLTTGNQSISGVKVFTSSLDEDNGLFVPISGNDDELRSYFKGMDGNYTPFEIVYNNSDNHGEFYLRSYDGTTESIVLSSVDGTSVLNASQSNIDLLNVKSINSATTPTHFAVFNNNPTSDRRQLLSRSTSSIKSDIGLGSVEDTALSSWPGSANITTLGTITTGTWSADTIAVNRGGTGQTSYSNGELLIGSGTSLVKNTLSSGDGISITNGSGSITVATNSYVVKTTGTQTINGLKTFNNSVTINCSPVIVGENSVLASLSLNNAFGNMIRFNDNVSSSALSNSFTGSPSGTKLLLREFNESPDVALGLNSSSLWQIVPSADWDYEWYAGSSKIATLFGDGTFNTTNISGTNFYLNGTKIDSTAAQINLLSTGNDGDILLRSGGNFTRVPVSAAVFGSLYSNTLTLGLSNSQTTIEHKNTSQVSNTATNFPSGTVVSNLSFDAHGHVVRASGSNLDERYVQISNLDTSLNFVSGIASEYDVANKVLNVFHDDTCPTYNDSSNTLGTDGIASITFDTYGHITDAATAIFLTAETVCDAITGCTIDGGTF
jgi:hypothetical protein